MAVKFVLASGSPRRRDFLSEAGYDFGVEPSEVEEWPPGKYPFHELCVSNAVLKARDVLGKHADAVVLGADTLVGLEGEVMGKPRDIEDAVCMLERLSGQRHEVCTGVCLCCGTEEYTFFEVTWVQFRDFGSSVIRDYMDRVSVMDKAGAYAIQEHGEMLVEGVEGSYDNVVGLPMNQVKAGLKRFGVMPSSD